MNELERFLETWEREAAKTAQLLASLPPDQYDFRPDPQGRSLGELAWHLAEADAYIPYGIAIGEFARDRRPPGIERPRRVEELAPAFERIHRDSVERLKVLTEADLDRRMTFFSTGEHSIRSLLWDFVVMHAIHHRGQLSLMCRLAGGRPAAVFGPTREDMPLPKAAA